MLLLESDNAINEICALYTNHKLENDEAITVVGKDAMVSAAYSEGLIQSACCKTCGYCIYCC